MGFRPTILGSKFSHHQFLMSQLVDYDAGTKTKNREPKAHKTGHVDRVNQLLMAELW